MLTIPSASRYASFAGAKSSAGRENPTNPRRTSAPYDGAIFMPVNYGGRAWARFDAAGSLGCRFLTPRTVTTQSREKDRGDSNIQGVSPMQARFASLITRSLSSRAAAHRAMAKSALFADGSASTRLKRYNHHIEKAELLEARALNTAKRSVGGDA